MAYKELVETFKEKLKIPDPPHCTMFRGVNLAAEYLLSLDNIEKNLLYDYIERQIDTSRYKSRKQELIIVLQLTGEERAKQIINKVLNDGLEKYDEDVISYANKALFELNDYPVSDFIKDLEVAINKFENQLNERRLGVKGTGNVYELKNILKEIKTIYKELLKEDIVFKDDLEINYIRQSQEIWVYNSSLSAIIRDLERKYNKVKDVIY